MNAKGSGGAPSWAAHERRAMNNRDRQEVIAEICDCLDEGDEMVAEYQCPRPFGPITVIFSDQPPSKQKWRLKGLFPAKCARIRSHLLEVEWRDGPDIMHEMCVVATLATLLHERGIRLDPATVIFLHGKAERRYARVSFVEAVEQVGWDKAADFLVEQQEKRDRKDQAPTIRRRGRGRPKGWDKAADFLVEQQNEARSATSSRYGSTTRPRPPKRQQIRRASAGSVLEIG